MLGSAGTVFNDTATFQIGSVCGFCRRIASQTDMLTSKRERSTIIKLPALFHGREHTRRMNRCKIVGKGFLRHDVLLTFFFICYILSIASAGAVRQYFGNIFPPSLIY